MAPCPTWAVRAGTGGLSSGSRAQSNDSRPNIGRPYNQLHRPYLPEPRRARYGASSLQGGIADRVGDPRSQAPGRDLLPPRLAELLEEGLREGDRLLPSITRRPPRCVRQEW